MNADLRRYCKVGAILCLIGGISALFITGANLLTASKIQENEIKKQEEAFSEVYPEAVAYSDESTLEGNTYVTNSWVAYGDEAKSLALGTIYKASGKNNYGSISLLVGVNGEGLGRLSLITNTETYGDTLVTNYVNPYNAGTRKIDDTSCGATYGAKLIYAMASEALTLYKNGGSAQ
jgi:Na+-translocating ferredoxin:NAD+ oxidoreductase RnfG subunit